MSNYDRYVLTAKYHRHVTCLFIVLEAIVLKKVNILYIEFGTSGRSWRQLYYSQMLKWQMMQPWVTILGSSSPTPPPPQGGPLFHLKGRIALTRDWTRPAVIVGLEPNTTIGSPGVTQITAICKFKLILSIIFQILQRNV